MNKTETVKILTEAAKQDGLVYALHRVFGNSVNVSIGFSKGSCNTDIEEMALSVRSYNSLRRANVSTIGDLIERLNEGGLKSIRNLGAKSYGEIQTKILAYGFSRLSENEKREFFYNLYDNNIAK